MADLRDVAQQLVSLQHAHVSVKVDGADEQPLLVTGVVRDLRWTPAGNLLLDVEDHTVVVTKHVRADRAMRRLRVALDAS